MIPWLQKTFARRNRNAGGNGIIHLTKKDGTWRGTRDIILGLNVPQLLT
ncbi:MAG: hypothetical protein WDO15_16960 [Bacteroidota bacterium]